MRMLGVMVLAVSLIKHYPLRNRGRGPRWAGLLGWALSAADCPEVPWVLRVCVAQGGAAHGHSLPLLQEG